MSKIGQQSLMDIARLQQTQDEAIGQAFREHVRLTVESGMQGQPMPYRMQADWVVTGLLFFCFILLSLALKNGKRYIAQHVKGFFQQKERASLFFDMMGNDLQFTFILGGVTCILWGVCIYDYYVSELPVLFEKMPHWVLLAVYVAGVAALILFKRMSYGLVNWIFFDKMHSRTWINAYFDVLAFTSFLLFPFLMLVVYFDLEAPASYLIVLSILGFTKILLFYKCIRNFFVGFAGLLHLILYFCALEIIPDYMLWKAIEYINSVLI